MDIITNKKNFVSHDNSEYGKNFLVNSVKETKQIENSIQLSYDNILKNFFNLIETKYSKICRINRIKQVNDKNYHQTNKCSTTYINKLQDKLEQKFNNSNKLEKLVEQFEKDSSKYQPSNSTTVNNEQIRTESMYQKKNYSFLEKEKDFIKKCNVEKISTLKDKLNDSHDQIINKSKDNDLVFKINSPLACSSVIFSKESDTGITCASSKYLLSPKIDVKKQFSQDHYAKLTQSGKVKQMVEMVEARMKDLPYMNNQIRNTTLVTTKTMQTLTKSKNQCQEIFNKMMPTRLSNKFKIKKTASSIDQRKIRNSISNNDQKRKSIKKLNAFIKDIADNNTNNSNPPSIKLVKKNLFSKSETDKPSSQSTTETLNFNPKVISKTNKNQIETKNDSKPIIQPSVHNLYNVKDKSNFAKFLERNTPCKISKTVLLAKEKKENERLNERDKQIHEKAEIAKKKREEKMKKIAEIKQKNEAELKKRQDEISLQKTNEIYEIKKKTLNNENEKKTIESQKCKETLHHSKPIVNQLTETNIGTTAKNSSFIKKIEEKNTISNLQKENLGKIGHLQTYSSPKITSTVGIKNENATIQAPVFLKKPGQVNVLKKIDQNHVEQTKTIEYENYGINDINSSDETDDEEEPNKPIPNWAKDPAFTKTAKNQCFKFINYTKLFKASAQNEINLDSIFKLKRKKFYERSSSANWTTAPVWNTSGIHGNESFRQLHK
ncbi:unnamed protein product [Brachionus calyciflorus]|uniref:Inner centromere protein ARK-binding domain-containing protein n=1 Tax=Brachionus calyciflorus TaxID=104777 RepID=A0A813NAE6_9BILA|nr:unnamed protein product [Brachionus calyciflorus]